MVLNKTLMALALGLALSTAHREEVEAKVAKDAEPEQDPDLLSLKERVTIASNAPHTCFMAPIEYQEALTWHSPESQKIKFDKLSAWLDEEGVPTRASELSIPQFAILISLQENEAKRER